MGGTLVAGVFLTTNYFWVFNYKFYKLDELDKLLFVWVGTCCWGDECVNMHCKTGGTVDFGVFLYDYVDIY